MLWAVTVLAGSLSTAPRSYRPVFGFLGVTAIYLALVGHYYTRIGPYILDDAFIYFRYAHNLASGHGLVYNVGERVEGYSGFTWVVLIAAADRLGCPLIEFVQWTGVGLGVVTLCLSWRLGVYFIGHRPAALLPALFLATNRTFCVWSIEGLETNLFGTLLAATLLVWTAEERRGYPTRWPSIGLTAAGMALTRPEGFALAGALGVLMAVEAVRRRTLAHVAVHGFAFLVVTGSHLAFRLLYYGDLLPNTFHAKVIGIQSKLGLEYIAAVANANTIVLYAPITFAGMLVFTRGGELASPRRWTLLAVAFFTAYVVAIGGDYFEFRFIDPMLPIWALWTSAGSVLLADKLAARYPALRLSRATLTACSALWVFANGRGILQPPEDSLLRTTPEAEVARTRTFADTGRWLALNLQANDLIAIRPAGAIAYLSGARCLDLVGLNDREIARSTTNIDPGQSIGHQRVVNRDYVTARGVTYYVGHPQISRWPVRPGKGVVSVELSPGRFLLMHRVAEDASLQDTIYPLSQHRGSLAGWRPLR